MSQVDERTSQYARKRAREEDDEAAEEEDDRSSVPMLQGAGMPLMPIPCRMCLYSALLEAAHTGHLLPA